MPCAAHGRASAEREFGDAGRGGRVEDIHDTLMLGHGIGPKNHGVFIAELGNRLFQPGPQFGQFTALRRIIDFVIHLDFSVGQYVDDDRR